MAYTDDFDDESSRWELVSIDLNLDLVVHPVNPHGEAQITVRLKDSSSVGPTIEVYKISRIHAARLSGGQQLAVSDGGKKVRVRNDIPYPAGTILQLEIAFSTNRSRSSTVSMTKSGAIANWIRTGWYPSVYKVSERAPGMTVLRLPPDWQSISNGRLLSDSLEDSCRIQAWETDMNIGRSFAAGPFHVRESVADSLPVFIYSLTADSARVARLEEIVKIGLSAQQDIFGPFPYSRYSLVEAPFAMGELDYSLQHDFILLSPEAFTADSVDAEIISHKTAQAWWGQHIIIDYGDNGLQIARQALARLGTFTALEQLRGSAFAKDMIRYGTASVAPMQSARGYFQMRGEGKDKALSEWGNTDEAYLISGAKGAWVWYMLKRRIGENAFRKIMTAINKRLSGRICQFQEFKDIVMERAPSNFDMAAFWEQWFEREGAPEIDMNWSASSGQTTVTLSQETEPYDLLLDIGLVTGGDMAIETVHLTEAKQTFSFETASPPTGIILDPHHELLLYGDEYEPVTHVAVALVFLGGLIAGLMQAIYFGVKKARFYDAKDPPWGVLIGLAGGIAAFWIDYWAFLLVVALTIIVLRQRIGRLSTK